MKTYIVFLLFLIPDKVLVSQDYFGVYNYELLRTKSFAFYPRLNSQQSDTTSINDRIIVIGPNNYTDALVEYVDTLSIVAVPDSLLLRFSNQPNLTVVLNLEKNLQAIYKDKIIRKTEKINLSKPSKNILGNLELNKYEVYRKLDYRGFSIDERIIGSVSNLIYCPILGYLFDELKDYPLAPIRVEKIKVNNPGEKTIIRIINAETMPIEKAIQLFNARLK